MSNYYGNYNPYQPFNPASFQQTSNQLIKVNGLESAKAYQTQPGSTIALFDASEDYFYIKSTDTNNFPLIRRFRFVEEPIDTPNESGFITRQEFEDFKAEVLKNVKQSIQQTIKQNGSTNSTSKSNKE